MLLLTATEESASSFVVVPDASLIVWTVLSAILWIGLSFAVGRYAQRRGHGFWAFFAASLLFTPLLGLILATLMPRRAAEPPTAA